MNDMEMLRRAAELEASQNLPNYRVVGWEAALVGASQADIERLIGDQLIQVARRPGGHRKTGYNLTESGRGLVNLNGQLQERQRVEISGAAVLDALDLVVGYDDVKHRLASSLERRTRTHYLLEGPPASAKSVILEGVRRAIPDAAMVFGSQTSGPGLSDLLFLHQPQILLIDEIDKVKREAMSVLLGLMETGDVIETKSNKTRGIKLDTTVLAAGNATSGLPREIMDRVFHLTFEPYTRDEFIRVCTISLLRSEDCPESIARLLGEYVFDYNLGSVREARRLWREMEEPTVDAAKELINFRLKYSPNPHQRRRRLEAASARMPGM